MPNLEQDLKRIILDDSIPVTYASFAEFWEANNPKKFTCGCPLTMLALETAPHLADTAYDNGMSSPVHDEITRVYGAPRRLQGIFESKFDNSARCVSPYMGATLLSIEQRKEIVAMMYWDDLGLSAYTRKDADNGE